MSKEQQELLYEGYGNALKELAFGDLPYTPHSPPLDTIESFINKCKTDPEFSERWGLKIEERKLSLEERFEKFGLGMAVYDTVKEKEYWKTRLEETSTPTKLITITYNDKTIESYE